MTELKQRIQELENQIKTLDIENKFLKELRRLREADNKQHKNKQKLPFAISKNKPSIRSV